MYAVEPRSAANGPGVRYCVWTQGCDRSCVGCCNPRARALAGGRRMDVRSLARAVLHSNCEGLTLTGGEPLLQPTPVLRLMRLVRLGKKSVVLFTGRSLTQVRRRVPGLGLYVDVLVCGPYDAKKPDGQGLRASGNQSVVLVTNRYTRADLDRVPAVEYIIHKDGSYVRTGTGDGRWAGC